MKLVIMLQVGRETLYYARSNGKEKAVSNRGQAWTCTKEVTAIKYVNDLSTRKQLNVDGVKFEKCFISEL